MDEKNRELVVTLLIFCVATAITMTILFGDKNGHYDFAHEAAILELRMCKMELKNMTNVVNTCNMVSVATKQECKRILSKKLK